MVRALRRIRVPDNPKQVRVILPLLKARVTARDRMSFTISFGAEHGSPTAIKVSPASGIEHLDIRDGDLLTLYTEVLLAKLN